MATVYDAAPDPSESEREARRRHLSVWIAMLLLFLGCVGLGIYASRAAEGDQTFSFIALLIIFMTALAASSIVFKALDLGSKEEAFGLPSGSVRAMIAIGIMILFVVFGLPVVSSEPKELSSGEVQVPAEQLPGVIRLNSEQGFVIRVRDLGAAAAPPAAPGAAPTPGRPARIEIVRMNTVTDEQMDLNRQLLTAIVTLLTTVVGFYFGSRSATDVIKASPDARLNVGDGGNGGDGGGGGEEPKPNDPGEGENVVGGAAEEAEVASGAGGSAGAVEEATPEQMPDGINRQEADDLPEEVRATLPKLDPEETSR